MADLSELVVLLEQALLCIDMHADLCADLHMCACIDMGVDMCADSAEACATELPVCDIPFCCQVASLV